MDGLLSLGVAVALLAEGVDRNSAKREITNAFLVVALLAEGVDRNSTTSGIAFFSFASPSSRRAWIEITIPAKPKRDRLVALLAEGVDRNNLADCFPLIGIMSPSSRRAWIEIPRRHT